MEELPNWFNNKCLHLTYSPHSLERLKERCGGDLLIKPENIKLTRHNVRAWHKRTKKDISFEVVVPYNKREDMILIVQINGLVRTLYFLNKNYKHGSRIFKAVESYKEQRNIQACS